MKVSVTLWVAAEAGRRTTRVMRARRAPSPPPRPHQAALNQAPRVCTDLVAAHKGIDGAIRILLGVQKVAHAAAKAHEQATLHDRARDKVLEPAGVQVSLALCALNGAPQVAQGAAGIAGVH